MEAPLLPSPQKGSKQPKAALKRTIQALSILCTKEEIHPLAKGYLPAQPHLKLICDMDLCQEVKFTATKDLRAASTASCIETVTATTNKD